VYIYLYLSGKQPHTFVRKQPLGTNLDIGGSKFGFLGEKGVGT